MQKILSYLILCLCTICCKAESIYADLSTQQKNLWTISSILQNEQEESFGLFFSLSQQGKAYHASAAIIDFNQKKIIWQQDELAVQNDEHLFKNFSWHYSPINASLTIAAHDQDKQGFHLKFDLLEPTTLHKNLALSKELKLRQYWPANVNGHLRLNNEIFVTSNQTWVQNIWQNDTDNSQHSYQNLLCKFKEGDALSAIQVPELNAIRASYANLYNAQAEKQSISQFIRIHLNNDQLSQHIQLNQETLDLNPLWHSGSLQLYFAELSQSHHQGFCIYQENPWQKLDALALKLPQAPMSFLEKTIALSKKPFKIPFNLKNKITS